MYWNSVIYLGKEKETVVDMEVIKDFDFRMVFANEVSVKSQEAYKENKLGMTPEISFEIRREEYNEEEVFKVKGRIYYLVRTYINQRNGTIELYMTSKIGGKDGN